MVALVYRFIPAGAGNTKGRYNSWPRAAVHPRGCGEHFSSRQQALDAGGSSPRVRGTPPRPKDPADLRRFIPAGAGNTRKPDCSLHPPPVHPRGCGEHHEPGAEPAVLAGSSPRVRGTLDAGAVCSPCSRFIPAGAGNTKHSMYILYFSTVHPRGCGEHMTHLKHGY